MKVCRSKQTLPTDKPGANAIHAEITKSVQLFLLAQQLTKPAPKHNGIYCHWHPWNHCVARLWGQIYQQQELTSWNFLVTIQITYYHLWWPPIQSMGSIWHLSRYIPVTLLLQQQMTFLDDLHFLPGMTGAVISCRAINGLGILSYHSLIITNPEQPTNSADYTERYHAAAHGRGNHEGVSHGIWWPSKSHGRRRVPHPTTGQCYPVLY